VDGQFVGHGRILAGEYVPRDAAPLTAFFHAWGEDGESQGYYDASGRSLRKFFLKSPLNYRRISSHFTHRRLHPITKTYRAHLGVDYAAPTGTPVVALGGGRVVKAGWINGFGNTVQIRHNETFLTQYAHLSAYARGVRAGTRVQQGDVIGYVGQTGHATGPHLDFRVQQNGKWVNPLGLPSGPSEPLPEGQRAAFTATTGRARGLLDTLHAGEIVPLADPAGAPALARLDTPPPS
jgi:murein DD-endopeptidase MepM/ murein hydrolase activator NlpD